MAKHYKTEMRVPLANGSHIVEGRKLASFDSDIISVRTDIDSIEVLAKVNGKTCSINPGDWLVRTPDGLKVYTHEEYKARDNKPKEGRVAPKGRDIVMA